MKEKPQFDTLKDAIQALKEKIDEQIPLCADVIIERWENLTGRKAVLINDAG